MGKTSGYYKYKGKLYYDVTYDTQWPPIHKVFDNKLHTLLDEVSEWEEEWKKFKSKCTLDVTEDEITNFKLKLATNILRDLTGLYNDHYDSSFIK